MADGLMSYGAKVTGQFRRSAAYVDRILQGVKPAKRLSKRRQNMSSL